MRRTAIVQARMGSTRLPGKVAADLAGKPLLVRQLERLRQARHVDRIVVATTVRSQDDDVVDLAAEAGVEVFRGSEQDVLGRFHEAALHFDADLVIRLTGDCPLLCPEVVDRVVAAWEAAPGCDYASNVVRRTYPRGLDVEVFPRDVLERLHRRATSAPAREHVTVHLRGERPELFEALDVLDDDGQDHSALRWTVDEPADLELIREVYETLDLADRVLPYRELLHEFAARPTWRQANSHVTTWTPEHPAR